MVGALGARIERMPRNGEDLAALLARPSAPSTSVPDRRAASITTTPCAMPETSRLRRGKSLARGSNPGGISVTRHPRLRDGRLQPRILRRVDVIDAARENGNRAGRKARLVHRRIDAARQARDDDQPAPRPDPSANRRASVMPGRRRLPRSDDGDGGPLQQPPRRP